MKEALSILGGLEGLIAIAFVIALVTLGVILMWRRKRDPKIEMLLALMKDFPRDGNDDDPEGGQAQNGGTNEGQGPLGPNGFGGSALNDSDPIGHMGSEKRHGEFYAGQS